MCELCVLVVYFVVVLDGFECVECYVYCVVGECVEV